MRPTVILRLLETRFPKPKNNKNSAELYYLLQFLSILVKDNILYTMENIFNDKFKLLNLENVMYILFITASLIDIDINEKVRIAFKNQETPSNELRDSYIIAGFLILIVFLVFMIRNFNNFSKLTKDDEEYPFAEIRFIGSVLIVIGQFMALYYFINTTNFKKCGK